MQCSRASVALLLVPGGWPRTFPAARSTPRTSAMATLSSPTRPSRRIAGSASKAARGYLPSYQGYSDLVAYAQIVYADASRTAATVTVKATARDPAATLRYAFGDGAAPQISNSQTFDTSQKQPLVITVTSGGSADGDDKVSISLEPVDFIWNAPDLPEPPEGSDYRNGQKGAIVEMFGWPDDIEKECTFLAKAGYLGVKLYPHQEQVMSAEPFQNLLNPWYFIISQSLPPSGP